MRLRMLALLRLGMLALLRLRMLARLRPGMLALLALLLFGATSVYGQGVILPQECHRCPPIPMPRPVPIPRVLNIKSVKITTKIDAQVATTKVEQVFENDTPYRLEGSYFFPIPESASISDFAIYDGDKRMAAEIVERARARQIYNEIVRRQIDPGLLEYAGKDLFQASVFPIEPRSTKKIELTYSQVLKNEGGTVSYRYELGSGRRIQPQPIREIAASVEIKDHGNPCIQPARLQHTGFRTINQDHTPSQGA